MNYSIIAYSLIAIVLGSYSFTLWRRLQRTEAQVNELGKERE